MKNILFSIMIFAASQTALSQNVNHVNGGFFSKNIEYNYLSSKSILGKILFGIENSPVEFIFRDSQEGGNETSAFRIVRVPKTDSFRLEIMTQKTSEIDNTERIIKEEITQIVVPYKIQVLLSHEAMDAIKKHNEAAIILSRSDSLYKRYRPKVKTFLIGQEFAKKLHQTTSYAISEFKAEGMPPIMTDGNDVTFRCVVQDEVWTLTVHMPQNKSLKLTELFKQIMYNYKKSDEPKYINLLDEIH